MPRIRTATVTVAALGVLLGAAGTAAATGTVPAGGAEPSSTTATAAPKAGPKGDGARALCRRVPRINRRIDRALHRLNAGAGTRGSIARLQQRVDNAKDEGHTAIETFLNDRLTFRRSLVPMLEQRQKDLKEVRSWCQSHHNGKGAGKANRSGSSADGSAS
jgi:hypothetical protein